MKTASLTAFFQTASTAGRWEAVSGTLWQLNLDTLESREIGNMVEDLPYIFSIYNGNLYIGSSLFGALRYDVYPLDSQGMPGEKMDEASPDFICAEQNAFSLEEEVLPIPDCAAMLNGYFITKKSPTTLYLIPMWSPRSVNT